MSSQDAKKSKKRKSMAAEGSAGDVGIEIAESLGAGPAFGEFLVSVVCDSPCNDAGLHYQSTSPQ